MNLIPSAYRALAVAGALFTGVIVTHAAPTDLVNFSSPGSQNTGSSFWNLGFEFHVNSNISVTSLGVFDSRQNGLVQPQQVGLWTSGGTLLGSTFVDNSDPLQGFWRFHSLSSGVALSSGSDY